MSDNKLNSLGFDEDDFLSNLEFLKAKYSAYDDEGSSEESETQENNSKIASANIEETVADIFTYERGNSDEPLPNFDESSYDDDIYSEHSFTFDDEAEPTKDLDSNEVSLPNNDLYDETVILDKDDIFSYEKDTETEVVPEVLDGAPAWYLSGSSDYAEDPAPDEDKTHEADIKEDIQIKKQESESEPAPKTIDNSTDWYLSGSEDFGEETVSEESEMKEQAPADTTFENIYSDININETETEKPVLEENDDTDDFSDLDSEDDIKVIKKGEKSAFVTALMDAANKADKSSTSSDSKPKREKTKKAKAPKKQKATSPESKKTAGQKMSSKKKKIITIVIAVAVPVIIWLGMFLTDIILVKNWYTPFFSVEAKTYSDGSSTYVGAFYKIQFHVNENNTEEIERECLPWFVNGPNDK